MVSGRQWSASLIGELAHARSSWRRCLDPSTDLSMTLSKEEGLVWMPSANSRIKLGRESVLA